MQNNFMLLTFVNIIFAHIWQTQDVFFLQNKQERGRNRQVMRHRHNNTTMCVKRHKIIFYFLLIISTFSSIPLFMLTFIPLSFLLRKSNLCFVWTKSWTVKKTATISFFNGDDCLLPKWKRWQREQRTESVNSTDVSAWSEVLWQLLVNIVMVLNEPTGVNFHPQPWPMELQMK